VKTSMVLLKLKAREQGKEENKVHLVTCNHHKVMCDSTMKSAKQDLTPSVFETRPDPFGVG